MKQRKRAQLGTLTLEEVFPLIGQPGKEGGCSHEVQVQGITYKIKTGSDRLKLFLANRSCVMCGREGTHFILEQDENHQRPHLNLYSADGQLMTRDHIIPSSKGGKNHMSNYQTMCEECNNRKGDYYLGNNVETSDGKRNNEGS